MRGNIDRYTCVYMRSVIIDCSHITLSKNSLTISNSVNLSDYKHKY